MKISSYLIKEKKSKLFFKIFVPVALIAVIIMFITFYGLSTGNLYIGIGSGGESKNISIDLEKNSTKNNKSLTMFNLKPTSPGYFDLIGPNLDEITAKDGKYEGALKDNLVAANFYIKNRNNNLDVNLKFSAIVSDISDGSNLIKTWNMLIISNDEYYLYHNSDYDKFDYGDYKYLNMKINDYKDGNVAFEGILNELKAGEVKRISIIIWNIGYDGLEPEQFKLKIYFQATDKEDEVVI